MSKSKWDSGDPICIARWGKIEMCPMKDGTVSLCVLPIKDTGVFQGLTTEEAMITRATLSFSPFATVHLKIEEVEDLIDELQQYVEWRKGENK